GGSLNLWGGVSTIPPCQASGRGRHMVVETKRVETERPTQAEPASRRSIGARLLCQALEREGVDLIFGYPGGAVIPLYDVLPEFNIHHVLVRHEQGAA